MIMIEKQNGFAINDDCENLPYYIGNERFDLQIHDIPYIVSSDDIKFQDRTDVTKDFSEWDHNMIDLKKFAKSCSDRCKSDGSVIIFFNNFSRYSDLFRYLTSYFSVVDGLVWCKRNPMPQIRKRHFVSAHELIIWAARGKYTLNNASHHRMFSYKDNSDAEDFIEPSYVKTSLCQSDRLKVDGKSLHPTQKPLNLIKYYIKRLSNEGDSVLDMYAGTLTTARACDMTNRRYVVCEINEKYFNEGIKTLL